MFKNGYSSRTARNGGFTMKCPVCRNPVYAESIYSGDCEFCGCSLRLDSDNQFSWDLSLKRALVMLIAASMVIVNPVKLFEEVDLWLQY